MTPTAPTVEPIAPEKGAVAWSENRILPPHSPTNYTHRCPILVQNHPLPPLLLKHEEVWLKNLKVDDMASECRHGRVDGGFSSPRSLPRSQSVPHTVPQYWDHDTSLPMVDLGLATAPTLRLQLAFYSYHCFILPCTPLRFSLASHV